MDRILRRSLGVSETAPTDTTVKPAPPVAQEALPDEDFDFDDSHMRLDPEALGLKVGKPVLFDEEEDPFKTEWKRPVADDSEAAQKPLSHHDEL
jgi:heat shock protein 90kDa beta